MSIVEKDLTTVALCWRIGRRDGVTIGFTSHDRDMIVGGVRYGAAPGLLPSALSLGEGFDVDRLDVRGALTSDAITAEDMAAGRWDGAAVAIFMADWEDPDAAPIPLARGELGDVVLQGAGFEAELRGATARLERPVVEQTSPECRAQLGDKRCRVDMAGRVRMTRVAAIEEGGVVKVEAPAIGGDHSYGRVRWISGRNSGLAYAIARSDGACLTLRDPLHFGAAAGDLVELSEGCDRSFATCSQRFGNAENFRGEPHLPGTDLLTRYAGG